MEDPVTISVTANAISEHPDLSVRIWLRGLFKNYPELTPTELAHILRDEADKIAKQGDK